MKNLKIRTLLLISFIASALVPLFILHYILTTLHFSEEIFWIVEIVTTVCAALLAIYISNTITKPIHELLQKVNEVESLQEKMIAQEKLASMGMLTAGIVHEIKNPLNFINNFSELCENQLKKVQEGISACKEKLPLNEKEALNKNFTTLESNLKKIRQYGLKANSIISRMLEQVRTEVRKDFKSTDINALLEEHFKLAYHAKRSQDPSFNIQMQMDFDNDLGEVLVLPEEIAQVALNMLNNAFYAIMEKSQISGEDYQPIVAITTKKIDEDKMSISFYDNGTGIPSEIIEKMYNSFYTTKPPEEGTGLGLSLSRETIVTAHHGEILVDSKVGEYTTFTIILPLKRAA